MLLDYCQELEGHSTGLFAARLPLLNSGFAGIEVSGKNRLADMCLLTNMFDLVGSQSRWHDQARFIKLAHRGLVNRTYLL